MLAVGNVLVGLAALELLGFVALVFGASNLGLGALGLFMLLAIAMFFTNSALYCVVIAAGKLDAMHIPRFLLYPGAVVSCLCLIIFMMAALIEMRSEPSNMPAAVRNLGGFPVSFAVPALLIVLAALLLNHQQVPQVPMALLRGLLFALGIAGIAANLSILVESTKADARNRKVRLESEKAAAAELTRQAMAKVQAADPSAGFGELLAHSGSNWPTDIRQLAIQKMLSNGPKFTPLLAGQLRTGDHERALQFLLDHDVPDPAALAEPARAGMLRVTAKVRNPDVIVWATDFQRFTDVILGVADKYSAYGVDYVPAIRDYRAALSEPVPTKSFLPDGCVKSVDAWLARKSQ